MSNQWTEVCITVPQADTERAIAAFGSDEKLCFGCVGIDDTVPVEKVRDYLSVFRG